MRHITTSQLLTKSCAALAIVLLALGASLVSLTARSEARIPQGETPFWSDARFSYEIRLAAEAVVELEVPAAPPLAVAAPETVDVPVATPTPRPAPAVVVPAPAVPTPTPAPVVAPSPEPASLTPRSRGQAALGRVRYNLASIGYTISFHEYTGTHRGLTYTRLQHIEIYVKPSMSDAEIAYVIAHEVGHAVDHIRNTSEDRHAWRAARGMAPTLTWFPNGVGNDLATPAGDFAECFATWATGSPSHSAWGDCGSAISLMGQLASS